MVGEEEVAGGGDAAPGATDGAAAEEGFWGEAGEDLPDGELVREAPEERHRSCYCVLRHCHRLGAHACCFFPPRTRRTMLVAAEGRKVFGREGA
jgi:hypothetical protein